MKIVFSVMVLLSSTVCLLDVMCSNADQGRPPIILKSN